MLDADLSTVVSLLIGLDSTQMNKKIRLNHDGKNECITFSRLY